MMDSIVDFLFSLVWECQKKSIPDLESRHSFLAESAVELARRIREKELKSEVLVCAVIERIKIVNPLLNAVAQDRFEAALSEAREVDQRIAAGLTEEDFRTQPFLGVPFTTKESQPVKGLVVTLGLVSRSNERAAEDSEGIRWMRAAGAIPVAATNLPELLIWQETRNNVYGMTNNPHHTGRTPGGSSGAEAALTASYATPISLCSDIGGSTRMPAFYCGVFGHHPTANVTSVKGVFFRESDADSMFCLGIISKHAEDLAPLTKVIAGNKAPALNLDRNVNIKDIKFYYTLSSEDCLVSSIRPELRAAMTKVITKISSEVTTTSNIPEKYYHEGLNHMYKLWGYWMNREPDNFASYYNNRQSEARWYIELVKKMFCMSQHCLSAVIRLVELQLLPQPKAEWAEKLTTELKEDLFTKLGSNGVLLFPSSPHAAPYHYSAFLRPYNFAYWALINVLKCPATQVPLGVTSKGLPIGIQVVAAPHNDALCITVAKYLEKEFGGSILACNIQK